MKKMLFVLSLGLFVGTAHADTSLTISSASATGVSATVTITTPTAAGEFSTGGYNYISHITIQGYSTGGTVVSATPVTCTTSNLPTSPSFLFSVPVSTGTLQAWDIEYANPLRSTNPASNTVVSCPATANMLWNIHVGYQQK